MPNYKPRAANAMTLRIYAFIRDYRREHRTSPSLREVGDAVYISHTTIMRHIDKLEGMGWLEREPNISRSLRLGAKAPDEE